MAEIRDTGIKALELGGHMGMPLDMGLVAGGTITRPYHGFRYDLSSGECLTAPEVHLVSHAVRVVGSKVEVKLRR